MADNQTETTQTDVAVDGVEETATVEASNTAADAATAATEAEANANKQWFSDYPEEMHDKLSQFESFDEAVDAAGRGKDVVIPKELGEYKLNFGEETEGAEDVINDFAQFCLDKKIPPGTAQELIDYQTQLSEKTAEDNKAANEQYLNDKWGNKKDQNVAQAMVAMQALDKRMDGKLAQRFGENGFANDAVVVEALHLISTLISEDSLGGASPGGADTKPKEAVDTYKDIGFK